jgi:hypothetical protein
MDNIRINCRGHAGRDWCLPGDLEGRSNARGVQYELAIYRLQIPVLARQLEIQRTLKKVWQIVRRAGAFPRHCFARWASGDCCRALQAG